MKRVYAVTVRGHQHSWLFHFEADPKYVQEWRDDGLEIFEVCNSIPEWIVNIGLLRPWCFIQDVFRFRNPFA